MKKIVPAGLLAALILTGCGGGEDRQVRYLERAKDYFAEENYDKAEIDAKNVLQINPKNTEAKLLLAQISFLEGDIRKAYGLFQAVVEEDDSNLVAHAGLAKLFVGVQGYEQALKHSDKVLDVETDNVEVMGYKAVALSGLERFDESRDLAERTLAIESGNSPALGVMTQLLVNEGKSEEALVLLEQGQAANPDDDRLALLKIAVLEQTENFGAMEKELSYLAEKHPDSKNYSNTLTRYYIRESRFDDAEAEVRKFAKNNSESLDAKRRLLSYLQQHKSLESAIEQARVYISEDPENSSHQISLARLHLFTGDKDKGLSVLESAIDIDPRSVGAIEARNIVAQINISDKDYEAARSVNDEILAIEPENEDALLRRAGFSLADRELEAGIADLRVVLKNNPENALALASLARAQEAKGNDQLALANYKKLMTLKEPDVDTLAGAARLAIKGEQFPEAERYIRQALELEGENTGLVTNLIRLLVLKEDWNEAEAFAQRLVDSEDSKALGYYLKAGLNLQLDKKQAALENLEKSIAIKPEAVESLTALAQVVLEERGAEKAIAQIGDHCEKYPGQAHCRYILGSLYAQNADYANADAELRKSLSINDQFVAGYRQLAKVFAAQRDVAGVEKTLKEGIDITDKNALRFELAGFYYGTQRYAESAVIYENILEANSEALAAKNNLAMIYAENIATPEMLKRARTMVVDLQESENPAFLDTVGWVMYLNGEYDQAVSYLKAAVDKVGSSALLQYHLGMAYYKSGNSELAREHLTLATQEESGYTGYEEALSTLQLL